MHDVLVVICYVRLERKSPLLSESSCSYDKLGAFFMEVLGIQNIYILLRVTGQFQIHDLVRKLLSVFCKAAADPVCKTPALCTTPLYSFDWMLEE